MSSLLEVRELCKTYTTGPNRIDVLNGIDLALQAGTTTALVGASGAGKSTLMHLLGALDRPTSGSVFFHGEDVFKKNDRQSGYENQRRHPCHAGGTAGHKGTDPGDRNP